MAYRFCNDIDVQNVTVANSTTLTLQAAGDINIGDVTITVTSNLIFDAGGEYIITGEIDINSGEIEFK